MVTKITISTVNITGSLSVMSLSIVSHTDLTLLCDSTGNILLNKASVCKLSVASPEPENINTCILLELTHKFD